jgi:excisionase family DNA binding protein
MTEDKILTVAEAAEILQVSAATVRRLLIDGKIPGFRAGSRWRISKNALFTAVNRG